MSCHSNVCKEFDLCSADFRKAFACLCVTHTAQISAGSVVLWKFTWEKDIDERKVYKPGK